jgi:multiple sugar transport system substrate-binding protein
MIRAKLALITAASAVALAANAAQAQDQQLTLCWAAWDPANALAELSKDFTAESGIQMNFEFVPWTNFADRFLNELNSGGKLCDLMIGDSQWLGAGAEYGHYVRLNDFFAQEGISMDDFLPATVYNYSTWPKGEPEYWALPAMGDALAWIYRKDWFARPEIQEARRSTAGASNTRTRTSPTTWKVSSTRRTRSQHSSSTRSSSSAARRSGIPTPT